MSSTFDSKVIAYCLSQALQIFFIVFTFVIETTDILIKLAILCKQDNEKNEKKKNRENKKENIFLNTINFPFPGWNKAQTMQATNF